MSASAVPVRVFQPERAAIRDRTALLSHAIVQAGHDCGSDPGLAPCVRRAATARLARVTYSIVARDPESGELGVAVQSQSFNTGAVVPWARPGVGAIATQSFSDRRYGYRGLELLAAGRAPEDALAELRNADELADFRQVGMIDGAGRIAQWTGARCVPEAGNARGDSWAAQGNLLASQQAWHAMGEAFDGIPGSLAQRLLAALDAAEATGGDWRGRGGAAIVVVPAEGEPWERTIDLRVEDGDDSLVELRRLLERAETYRSFQRADRGRSEIARAAGLPDFNVRWGAIEDALTDGDTAEAKRLYAELLALEPRWRDFARSLDAHPDGPSLAPLFDE